MPLWGTLLVGLVSALVGAAGVSAWVKVFAERKKLNVETAGEMVTISSTLLKDVYQSYTNINDELVQVRMECAAIQQERDDLAKVNQELRMTVSSQQFDLSKSQQSLNEESKKTWLARRQAHLIRNILGNYELHIEYLLGTLRENDITITPEMRPLKLRATFQSEMEKLEDLESGLTGEILKLEEKPDE